MSKELQIGETCPHCGKVKENEVEKLRIPQTTFYQSGARNHFGNRRYYRDWMEKLVWEEDD